MRLSLLVVGLVAFATLAAAGARSEDGAPPEPLISCANIIIGTDNGETKNGTSVSDCFDLRGGNDTAYGKQARDKIEGGGGGDLLYGGCGTTTSCTDRQDVIRGGTGGDDLFGQGGEDFIYAGGGSDNLSGGSGDDTLGADNAYIDTVNGGSGHDKCFVDRDDHVFNCEDVRVDNPPVSAVR